MYIPSNVRLMMIGTYSWRQTANSGKLFFQHFAKSIMSLSCLVTIHCSLVIFAWYLYLLLCMYFWDIILCENHISSQPQLTDSVGMYSSLPTSSSTRSFLCFLLASGGSSSSFLLERHQRQQIRLRDNEDSTYTWGLRVMDLQIKLIMVYIHC